MFKKDHDVEGLSLLGEQINKMAGGNKTFQPTPREMDALVQWLLRYEAEKTIQRAIEQHNTSIALSRQFVETRWYPFLAPMDPKAKPTIRYEDNNQRVVEKPRRQPFMVYLNDLPAFCKRFGLKEEDMRRIGEGLQFEHRGWQRCPYRLNGGRGEAGKDWKDNTPSPALEAEAARAARAPKRDVEAYTPAPAATVFDPAA